jgi:hypothetical protein
VVKALENIFGGEPTLNSYDGMGQYTSFIDGGGGGGGGYTPPVEPNPTFIPPTYSNEIVGKSIKINLISNSGEVEFLENGVSKGYGINTTINYSPSTTFNSSKKYEVSKTGQKSTKYYEVSIKKSYQSEDTIAQDSPSTPLVPVRRGFFGRLRDRLDIQPVKNTLFGGLFGKSKKFKVKTPLNIKPVTNAIEYNYSEILSVQEFDLQSDGTYNATNTQTYEIGSISLNFELTAIKASDEIKVVTELEYEVAFSSNFRQELANNVILNYTIFQNDGTISDSGKLSLADSNIIRKINSDALKGRVDFKIEYVNKPTEYSLINIYQTTNTAKLAEAGPNSIDFNQWSNQNSSFSLPAEQLKSGISVVVLFEKEINVDRPIINLDTTQYSVQVKDSDVEREIYVPFKVSNTDNVRVYIDGRADTILVPSSAGFVTLYFKKDFSEVYGTKKIVLVAESNKYGTGDSVTALITFTAVNDFPSITEITFADTIDVPSFSDLNIDLTYEYSSFATSTIDVDLKANDGSRISLFKSLTPNGNISINLKTLRDKFSNWSGNDGLSLIFKPFNRAGSEELIGNEYEIKTQLVLPSIQIDENIFGAAMFDSFLSQLQIIEPEKESRYLTHLANFDNNEQILISTWENDNFTLSSKVQDELGNTVIKDEVNSILLKLYEPIPTNIVPNTTFWITKLMANPLVETIVLADQANLKCPPLKGPNFNVDVDYTIGNSTNFESLDNLILSSSVSSSAQLISTYLSGSTFNNDSLNIEYTDGSTYLWNNFVHFSSAKERVDNFLYKVQLIEAYDGLIASASTDITNTGFINSVANQQELERQSTKKNQLVNGFDGFEKFLYTSSSAYTTNNGSSITWPYNNGNRISSNDTSSVLPWYNNIIELATIYDNNNQNYILNNIPQYIVSDENNDSLLLFFSMIGQHFDSIYYYTKSIEKSRGLGYKQTGGISDKLLFDALKSFSWDAKNLDADSKLWSYVFGQTNGETELNPTKQRTNEVWRRIVNNIPYLLKHKGTRRGVYALLSCYGIPSSNLSILEFGGPEVTETTKSKLVYDNITTALKFNSSAYISMGWKNTNKLRKPDTIELFVKPTTAGKYRIIDGDNSMALWLSGSVGDEYGKVKFTYSGSNDLVNTISSSLLPIFNDKFFGIEISRTLNASSSSFELNVKQSNKEKTIFQESISASVSNVLSDWENGTILEFGNGFVGSLDEFRIWNTPLDKERFYEHVSFPEMINGNSISASTTDLYFRLDFEYPKNLAVSQSLINVANNIFYPKNFVRNQFEETGSIVNVISTLNAPISASAIGFTPSTSYPYNFETIDRSVVLEIPDMGSTRYSTNKVRFESQTDFSGNDVSGGVDLSIKSRATKKAFDQSPTDSNRVGLFFSPTKELNIDIAKSLGGINLDNYIGDPSDNYKSNYSNLDSLRNYYFERFDGRDIYAYINLIKLYEKSMFEDIKNMLPARVKATTGLLIEPHILERSKIEQKRPTADDYQKEANIKYSDTTKLIADSNQYLATINSDLSEQLIAENNQYSATIYTASLQTTTADSYQIEAKYDYDAENDISSEYYQKEITINAGLGNPSILTEIDIYDTNTIVGQSVYETVGFGIYAQSGSAIRTYFDKEGRRVKERIRIQLVTEQKERVVTKFAVTASATGMGDPRGGYVSDIQTYNETTLNIQPFSGSIVPIIGGNIIDIKNVDGYLSTHYRNTNDLTRGMQNSFFRGSKNTAATTLDGSSPIETFTSNPNTLKVNKSGRDASEPILEVE